MSMLNIMDYNRLFNDFITPATSSSAFSLSSSYNSSKFQLPKNDKTSKIGEIIKMAESANGSQILQYQIQEQEKFQQQLLDLLASGNADSIRRLATDSNGNFVVQKLIEKNVVAAAPLIETIKNNFAVDLAMNRYGCRVIQKIIESIPSKDVNNLLNDNFSGSEYLLITDQNANHIIQNIVNKFNPEIYANFMHALIRLVGMKQVIENKYGCRVIQCALEKVVAFCEDKKYMESKSTALGLLRLLLTPIFKEAGNFARNEYANYIVQVILEMDFLCNQRRYIIKEHLMHNILTLSQGKYSSHVVEAAFSNADDECLEAMFDEVFDGYECDNEGRCALHFMLFNQYGNYVVQRMLEIAIQVRLGRRKGDPTWVDKIISYIFSVRGHLSNYSSGKKILEYIWKCQNMIPQYNWTFGTGFMRPFINPNNLYSQSQFTSINGFNVVNPFNNNTNKNVYVPASTIAIAHPYPIACNFQFPM